MSADEPNTLGTKAIVYEDREKYYRISSGAAT